MTAEKLGDGPIDPKLVARMNALARAIDEFLNLEGEKVNGFCLLVFPFGTGPGRCNYISNAAREDVVVLLKEQLARFQGQPEMEGRA